MKDLRGSELNPIYLLPEDFEEAVVTPSYKVQIYKNGWQNVDDVVNATVDFQGSIVDGVVSSSLNLTINDDTAKYHPLSGTQYSDYFTFRRKIKVFVGLKKDGDSYTWSYFTGNINTMQHKKTATNQGIRRSLTVRALDYCDVLNTFKFDKNVYWGSTTIITLQPNTYEYAMPVDCKGIHRVTKDDIEFTDWTYNWETNKIAITKDVLGTLKIYFFTARNVITVLQEILQLAGITETLIYTPADKTIDRVYFDEGTTALEAVKNLSQLINYRFWFDGDGIPHFEPVAEVGEISDFTFKDYKNLQAETVSIEDKEFYNAVEVFGEERTRKQYYKEEIQLGSIVKSYLDATVESRTHPFPFSGYGKLRYKLDCSNKNGLTSELNETTTGAEITVTHNPAQSREETETNLGNVTGSLFYALSGQTIINTSDTKFLNHVAATRIKAVVSDLYNKYGMQVSVTPESYWRTQLYLSHDPLRNLSATVATIGTANGTASPSGNLITVSFTAGKLWGNVRWETNYADGWGAEQLTGSGSWQKSGVGVWIHQINLNQNYQGQIRWEGTAPSNIPDSTMRYIYNVRQLSVSGYSDSEFGIAYNPAELVDAQGTAGVESPNLQIISTRWSGNTFYGKFRNLQSTPLVGWVQISARRKGTTYNIEYVCSGENWIRFKLSSVGSAYNPTAVFTVYVYSKCKPYNIKITNTKQSEFNAEFLATCEFGSPAVSITCKGQEPVARQYKVDLVGYRLVPRYYFLKLFGREEVSELTSSIYSQKTLTPTEIQETGGKKTLTIRNHLIQSQAEADIIAQNLLNHYKEIINSFVIEVSCPPPLEVGDTISIVSQY